MYVNTYIDIYVFPIYIYTCIYILCTCIHIFTHNRGENISGPKHYTETTQLVHRDKNCGTES